MTQVSLNFNCSYTDNNVFFVNFIPVIVKKKNRCSNCQKYHIISHLLLFACKKNQHTSLKFYSNEKENNTFSIRYIIYIFIYSRIGETQKLFEGNRIHVHDFYFSNRNRHILLTNGNAKQGACCNNNNMVLGSVFAKILQAV